MSNFANLQCLNRTTIQPNSTILAGIEACQAAANTPFCFPPNGTRICVPAEGIPFYWPRTFYPHDARLAIKWNPDDQFLFTRQNTGNRTQGFTPFMFQEQGVSVPGKEYEKTIQMYFLSRRFNDDVDPQNLEVFSGPEIVMVQTTEFSSTTSAFAIPTASSRCRGSSCDDDNRNLHPGAIAGIVLGSIFAAVFFAFCCCVPCCLARRKGHDERTYIGGDADMTQDQRDVLLVGAGLSTGAGTVKVKIVPTNTQAHRETPRQTSGGPGNTVASNNDGMDITPVEVERVEQRREEIERANAEDPPPYARDAPPAYKP